MDAWLAYLERNAAALHRDKILKWFV
jgi:hypothetical protein